MQKQDSIVDMFNQIAPSYDRANRVMSLGIDVRWRKEACKVAFEALGQKPITRLLDVACGTGDMIQHWHNEILNAQVACAEFVGIDPSQGMLEVAHQKLETLLRDGKLKLVQGEAKALEIESESVDILSIAYGLRNVVELDLALDEFARVLKKGGILVILDFMNDDAKGVLSRLMNFYMQRILPFVGALASQNYKAYRYLPDSIKSFTSSLELVQRLESRGIDKYLVKGYSANISTLYVGIKA